MALAPVVDDNTKLRFVRFAGNDFGGVVERWEQWSKSHQLGQRCNLIEFMNQMHRMMRNPSRRSTAENLPAKTDSTFKFKNVLKFLKSNKK